MFGFYVGAGDSNSDPQVCKASSFLPESPPQHPICAFRLLINTQSVHHSMMQYKPFFHIHIEVEILVFPELFFYKNVLF